MAISVYRIQISLSCPTKTLINFSLSLQRVVYTLLYRVSHCYISMKIIVSCFFLNLILVPVLASSVEKKVFVSRDFLFCFSFFFLLSFGLLIFHYNITIYFVYCVGVYSLLRGTQWGESIA